jgi:hypothetical protein
VYKAPRVLLAFKELKVLRVPKVELVLKVL